MAASKAPAGSKETAALVSYRLEQVELAVKSVDQKLSNLDNIKKSDLKEFRDSIITQIKEMRDNLQKQIDELDEKKADHKSFEDFKKVFYAIVSFISSILGAWIIYSITRGQ